MINAMRIKLLCVALLLLFHLPGHANERQTFLYTVSPFVSKQERVYVHLNAGWGEGSLGFSEGASVDQRLGIDWHPASRWMIQTNLGFGKSDSSSGLLSTQVDCFYALRNGPENRLLASVGGGVRWERDGGTVGTLKMISGWQAQAWRLDGNMTLEKSNAPDRDPIDVILSMGWSHRVTDNLNLGVEAVGQDLEGFWEPDEAEGGARILLGPSIHFHLDQWEGGLAGGYNFHPTVSGRTSPADRPFGSDRWVVQISFGRSF